MKRFLKFLVLAVLGFALGAGAAWLGNRGNGPATPAPVTTAAKNGADKNAPVKSILQTDDKGNIVMPEKPLKPADAEMAGKISTPENKAEDDSNLTGVEKIIADQTLTGGPADPDKAKKADNTEPAAADSDDVGDKAAAGKKVVTMPTGVGEGYFSLLDQRGNPVTEKSWPDKYLLVFFGFTHCPDICPMTLQRMSDVLDKLGDEAQQVQPLFITVDPARDTPDVLAKYLSNFNKQILGLTGSETQVQDAEEDFKVYAKKGEPDKNGDYDVTHTSYVYLMSPGGKMAELFKAGETVDEILAKMKPHLANPDINRTAPPAPKLP